jgi:tetratricopeptide (TPR) repeat protein
MPTHQSLPAIWRLDKFTAVVYRLGERGGAYMTGLKNLINEAHRRSLWQVLGVYLVASWLVFQVVQTLTEGLGLPDWVPPLALVLLLIGLPIVVATAFVQEGGPATSSKAVVPVDETEDAEGATSETAGGRHVADQVQTPGPAPADATQLATHHRLFTWRNAILGGVLAFALLGILTAGYMATRSLGIGPAATLVARGVIDERQPILLADFESTDSLLARAATEAFRVDLSQSSVVRLVESGFLAGALERMDRQPGGGIDVDLATEVALREGIQAVIAGEIVRAGGSYILSARLISPADGASLLSQRETAADSTEIIAAIDALSNRIRERVGESLVSIRGNPPLERVTTPDLEALRKYSQAIRAIELEGDEARGISLLEEAVALDTAFAMAYRKLGVVLANRGEQRAREIDAFTSAYRHRDRLTERERYITIGSYYSMARPDLPKAMAAYENALVLDPSETAALNNLGIAYQSLRDFMRAEEYFLRAAQADSLTALFSVNVVTNRISQGDLEGARIRMQSAAARWPDNPFVDMVDGNLAVAEGRYEEARASYETARSKESGSPARQVAVERRLASIDAIEGKLRAARARQAAALELDRARGLAAEYLIDVAWGTRLSGALGVDTESALDEIAAALEQYPLEDLDPLDRPYADLALAFAAVGRPVEAERMLDALEAEVAPEFRVDRFLDWPLLARGVIALERGQYEAAIEHLRGLTVGLCMMCGVFELAQAYDLAGQADSAIVAYERYAGTPWSGSWRTDPFALALTLERLGQIHDERREWAKASGYYARFVDLWKDADPELQPRVRAAQRRLDEIFALQG